MSIFDGSGPAGASHYVPQAEGVILRHEIVATVSISDLSGLWKAAAERILASEDLSDEELVDLIGSEAEPNIETCVTTLITAPHQMAGLRVDDVIVRQSANFASDEAFCSRIESEPGVRACQWRSTTAAESGLAPTGECGTSCSSSRST